MRVLLTIIVAFASASKALAAQGVPDQDARIEAILDQISADRMAEHLRVLAGYHTRHTMSVDLGPGRGIVLARECILEQFRSFLPRLEASLDCYRIPEQGRIPDRLARGVDTGLAV